MNKELIEYLDVPDWNKNVQISEGEAPEVMLSLYIFFRRLINNDCLIIEVTDKELRCKKHINGLVIDKMEFPIVQLDVPSTMRKYFDLVLSRDSVINSNLELVYESNDKVVYRIL